MNNYGRSYSVRTYSTWTAMMLVGVVGQMLPHADAADYYAPAATVANSLVQPNLIESTGDGILIKPIPASSDSNASLVLSIASEHFVGDLSMGQQSLGYEFAKVIEDNFFDLLA